MSVNSKMTAIADIFRAIGSIDNDTKFSLDEMAQYLEYIRTTIEQAYELAISKGGIPSNPSRAPIMNLAEAVYNIPSGGTTAQRKEGSFTTDINGLAEINCGFTPDIVIFTDFFSQNYGYECQAAIVFSEKKNDYRLFARAVSDVFFMGVNFEAWQISDGFGVRVFTTTESEASPVNNFQFPYVAIKYT
ncbi:MAG: hypothetical protein J6W00_15465 [Lentisphaeria bacterium]|nr:hypothetical protein [Lentisphaeria bacterium]